MSNFYDSAAKKGEEWQTYLENHKPKAYIRIVYNFCGFASPCIEATNAYNREVKNANFPILLMQGDRLQLGDRLFNILTNLNECMLSFFPFLFLLSTFRWLIVRLAQTTTLQGSYDLPDLRWIDK
jgi:hypothetical protein